MTTTDSRSAVDQQTAPVGDGLVVLDTVLQHLDAAVIIHGAAYHFKDGQCADITNPENIKYLRQDLISRAEMGKKKYGTYLRINNNRSAIVDLYQEVQDALMYSMQARMEGDSEAGQYFELLYQIGSQIAGTINKRLAGA